MSEKLGDFVCAQVTRMPLLMKENEALDPIPVSLFGSQTKVPKTRQVTHLFAKSLLGHVMHNTAFHGIMKQF